MEEFQALRGQREGENEESFFSRMAAVLRLWLAYLVASHRKLSLERISSFFLSLWSLSCLLLFDVFTSEILSLFSFSLLSLRPLRKEESLHFFLSSFFSFQVSCRSLLSWLDSSGGVIGWWVYIYLSVSVPDVTSLFTLRKQTSSQHLQKAFLLFSLQNDREREKGNTTS